MNFYSMRRDVARHYDRRDEISLWHFVTALRAVALGLRPRSISFRLAQFYFATRFIDNFFARVHFMGLFGA